jgi:hypothetical protein
MPNGLREHFAEMSDAGVPFSELVVELDTYRDRLSRRRYDDLWLFCWALAKRQGERSVFVHDGERWPDLSCEGWPEQSR